MNEVKVLSDEKLRFIRSYDLKLEDIYLSVENGCQKEITLEDTIYCMNKIYDMVKHIETLNTYKDNIEKENKVLRDIVISKEYELYQLKKTNKESKKNG